MRSRQIRMQRYGPAEVLALETVDLLPLRPNEVRLRTLAAAINHSDLEIRAGNWPIRRKPPFPYVPGLEVVGEVLEGRGAGSRAWTMMQGLGGVRAERDGGYAEHVTVSEDAIATVPSDIDPVDLAALGLAAVTAYGGLAKIGPLQGKTVVVTGAAGGVGSAAVGLAKSFGARVVAIASHNVEAADQTIGARTGEELAAALGEHSADGVLDTVAGPLYRPLVKSLRQGGCLSLVGAVGGSEVTFDGYDLLFGVSLTGYSSEELDGARLRQITDVLIQALQSGRLKPPRRTVFPLAEAARAHAMIEKGEVQGRVVLVPSDQRFPRFA